MNTSQFVPQTNSIPLTQNSRYWRDNLKKNPRFLDGIEWAVLASSSLAAIAAMIFQQTPLAIATGLAPLSLSQINRLRQESERCNNQAASIMETKLAAIETKVNDLAIAKQEAVTISEQDTSKYVTKQYLAPFKSVIQEFHQKHRVLEMKIIPDMEKQGEEFKEKLNSLETQLTEIKASLANQKRISNSEESNIENPRVAVFIDEANIFHSSRELNESVDYKLLLNYLAGDAAVVGSYFYTGVDPQNKEQSKFLYWLSHNGFSVVTKRLIQRQNGSKKANLDIEIALDMLGLQDRYDVAILVSGDGDFICAVNKLAQSGKRIVVASFRSTTSKDLIKAAHQYIDLSAIAVRELICK
jgi:uncharacterized LabA/DUF88 family protein